MYVEGSPGLMLIVFSIIIIFSAFRNIKENWINNAKDLDKEFCGKDVWTVILIIAALFLGIVSLCTIRDCITALVNPDYYIFEKIMYQVKEMRG